MGRTGGGRGGRQPQVQCVATAPTPRGDRGDEPRTERRRSWAEVARAERPRGQRAGETETIVTESGVTGGGDEGGKLKLRSLSDSSNGSFLKPLAPPAACAADDHEGGDQRRENMGWMLRATAPEWSPPAAQAEPTTPTLAQDSETAPPMNAIPWHRRRNDTTFSPSQHGTSAADDRADPWGGWRPRHVRWHLSTSTWLYSRRRR